MSIHFVTFPHSTAESQEKAKAGLTSAPGSGTHYWFQSDNADDNNLYGLQSTSGGPQGSSSVAYNLAAGFFSHAGSQQTDSPFIWIATLRSDAAQRGYIVGRLAELANEVQKDPATLSYAILTNAQDEEEVVVFERYASPEALHDVHEKSPIYKTGFSIRASFSQMINKRKGEGFSQVAGHISQ